MIDLPAILEQISARGWPPEVCETIGQWRLHAAQGYSGRTNACWPIGGPDRPILDAVAAVETWYQGRHLPPLFRPADIPATEALRQALATLGYRPRTETLVMVGPLNPGDAGGVWVGDDPDPDFTRVFLATATDPNDAAERIETLARIARPRVFARLDVAGAPAAIGAAGVEGDWVGLFGMRTVPEHRRQGLARRILTALSQAAGAVGAQRAYLQVEAINAPAIALYRGLGFETAYRYRYWAKG